MEARYDRRIGVRGERYAYAEELMHEFRFPDGFEFSIAIGVGHRAMDKAPHETDPKHIITV